VRVGNKGKRGRCKKRLARIRKELRKVNDRKRRGHGWAARQASRIKNRRSYQGSVAGSKYYRGI